MKTTPLYDAYPRGASFIDFYGWNMPVWFDSIEREHMSVRTASGVFDISHMNRTRVKGRDAASFLDLMCTANASLTKPGRLMYTYLLNEKGGIIDDGIFTRLAEDEFLFVTNACTKERVDGWLLEHSRGFAHLSLEPDSVDNAMIALQGPTSLELLRRVLGVDLTTMKRFEALVQGGAIFSTSGYTGEKGAEVVAGGEYLRTAFRKLVEAGAKPCGLGARDTLRLEMGYPLACVDTNEDVTPLELGGERFVDLTKKFVGREGLLGRRTSRRFMGVITDGTVVLRGGYTVVLDGDMIPLTSGTLSPVLKRGIGLGFFPAGTEAGKRVKVSTRRGEVGGTITIPPFLGRR